MTLAEINPSMALYWGIHLFGMWNTYVYCSSFFQVFQVRKVSGQAKGQIFAMKVLKKVRQSICFIIQWNVSSLTDDCKCRYNHIKLIFLTS